MHDRFGARDPRSLMMRFHTQTAGSTLTAQQPQVNIVRVTLQALAAVLGGTQSLHTNGMDEALGLPTAEAARIALRTQQVIAYESGVTQEPDPLGGSPYIEQLTDQLEAAARDYLNRIDRLGGTVAAIESGYIQNEIQNAAYADQRAVETGERIIVGVNRFTIDEPVTAPVFQLRPELESTQIARVRELRATRDAAAWQSALDEVRLAASSGGNLMPPILRAALAHATVGEIADALRSVFGEYAATA
jgi:methylmalonyl-CoA mutase N-terminal domain/subunit